MNISNRHFLYVLQSKTHKMSHDLEMFVDKTYRNEMTGGLIENI